MPALVGWGGLTTSCSGCFTTVERLRRGMVVARNSTWTMVVLLLRTCTVAFDRLPMLGSVVFGGQLGAFWLVCCMKPRR